MIELPSLPKLGQRFRFARTMLAKKSQAWVANELEVSPQAVSQWERGEDAPTRGNIQRAADLFEVPLDWLWRNRSTHLSRLGGAQAHRVPKLSKIKAGLWSPAFDPFAPDAADSFLYTEENVSDQALALDIDGSSMEPDFRSGDTVIIDPRVQPIPGDFVAAKLDSQEEATFKKYRPRGPAADGTPIIELVPLNDDWPVLFLSSESPGHIIGTMVEHRKYRRR